MLTWCINYIVFVQVAADCYYWFPMPYGLLKPCVLFFLRKIARNYSIVTHQKSCISLYRGVKPFTYCRPAVIDYSKDLFYFWCVSVLFRACDMLIFFPLPSWYTVRYMIHDISCERSSSVSRVTSLDLVKSVSTASKGLLRWLGWSIPFWEPCSWINS